VSKQYAVLGEVMLKFTDQIRACHPERQRRICVSDEADPSLCSGWHSRWGWQKSS